MGQNIFLYCLLLLLLLWLLSFLFHVQNQACCISSPPMSNCHNKNNNITTSLLFYYPFLKGSEFNNIFLINSHIFLIERVKNLRSYYNYLFRKLLVFHKESGVRNISQDGIWQFLTLIHIILMLRINFKFNINYNYIKIRKR